MKNQFTILKVFAIVGCLGFFPIHAAGNAKEDNVIFYEGFNEIWEPFGWTFTQLGNSLQQWDQALPGYLGPGAKHLYTSDGSQYSNAWMITPPIDLPSEDSFFLSFWEKNEYLPYPPGSFSGVFISSGSGDAGHEDFQLLYTSNQPISNYTLTEINISAYAGETIYVAFVYQGAYSHDWYVDEVTIEQVTLLSATLNMEEPIGTGSVSPEPGPHHYSFPEGNEPVVELSALPGLGYTFYSWNLGNVANPAHPRTTITMDQDHTVQATFPSYPDNLILFWHKYGFQNMGGNSTVDPETDLETLDNFSNNNIEEITKLVAYGWASKFDGGFVPWIPQQTEPFIVRFYDAPQNALPPNFGNPVSEQNIIAKVFKHGVEQFGTTQRTIYKFELDLLNPVALQSGWVSVQINGNEGAEGWFIWIAGEHGQGNGNNSSFRRNRVNNTFIVLPHDVHIEIWGTEAEVPTPPSCVNPMFPAHEAENIGYPIGNHPVITLEWSTSPDADGYVIYFGETLPDEGIDVGDANTFTPDGLAYNTAYLWKVVPYNDNGNAEECDVWTFTTMEDPTITPPFSVEFSETGPNWIPPDGWDDRKYGKLTENTLLTQGSIGQWIYQSFAHIPENNRAAKVHLTTHATPPVYAWFISPPVNLPADPHDNVLYFDIAVTLNNSSTPAQLTAEDTFNVVISTDGGASWSNTHIVFELSGANGDQVQPGGQTFQVPLADYQGIIKIGFYAERENPAAEMDIFLGNISVFEAFQLNLISSPAEGGTTQGAGMYPEGEQVELLAIPATGYQFIEWTDSEGETISNEAAFLYTMPAFEATLTAHFELADYTLTVLVSPEDAGTVIVDPLLPTYNMGDEIILTAQAAEDFAFVHWLKDGDILDTSPGLTFTMPAQDVSIEAVFVSTLPQVYTLSLMADPEHAGTLTGGGDYEEGTQVTVSATANDGFVFVNWTDPDGNVVSSQASFQITMPSMDITIIAVFQTDETSLFEPGSQKINLYPNPTTGVFTIEADNAITRVDILDASGKVLFSDIQNQQNQVVYHLNLSAGLYFVKIRTGEEVFVRKLNVQK